ncbi:MAG: hypothetical protein DRQ51_01030 [Gammaproteobacteria bacterium]|nr:MAG: hypothetical protein DRQ51_01030 [Gammaproteobacteria bacterium]
MPYKIIPTPEFIKNVKNLRKKFKNIKTDIENLSLKLENNPTIGTKLSTNTYKIRLKNSDINKGKSGGYRVITYIVNQQNEIILLTIYAKSNQEIITDSEIEKLIDNTNN